MTAGRSWPYPAADELLAAVADWLAQPGDKPTFHQRVAANSLRIIGREMAAADEIAAGEADRVARLGQRDMTELAAAIRSGALDDRLDELVEVLRESARARLSVDRPGYDS